MTEAVTDGSTSGVAEETSDVRTYSTINRWMNILDGATKEVADAAAEEATEKCHG